MTFTQDQLVDDRTWYRSAHANVHARGCGLDSQLITLLALPARGVCTGFMVSRAWGERPMGERERRLVRLAHLELIRLYQQNAARSDELADLPPRLSQTLRLLIGGDGEKQIALKLGISAHTVHDYVKALHKRFGVASRGELLAKVLTRPRTGLVLPFWLSDPRASESVPRLGDE